jgi:hypothetical protein
MRKKIWLIAFLRLLVLCVILIHGQTAYARDFVRQSDISSCGPDVLREVIRMRGGSISDQELSDLLDQKFPSTVDQRNTYGASFSEMSFLVQHYIGKSAVLTANVSDIARLANQIDILIAIETSTTKHFVVISSLGRASELMIVDPLFGVARIENRNLEAMLTYNNSTERFTFIPLVGAQVGKLDIPKQDVFPSYVAIRELGSDANVQTYSFGLNASNQSNYPKVNGLEEIRTRRAFFEYSYEWPSRGLVYSLGVGAENVRRIETFSSGAERTSFYSGGKSAYLFGNVAMPFGFNSRSIQLEGVVSVGGGAKRKLSRNCGGCDRSWATLGVDLSFAFSGENGLVDKNANQQVRWYQDISFSLSRVDRDNGFQLGYGINWYVPQSRVTWSSNFYASGPTPESIVVDNISLSASRLVSNDQSVGGELVFNVATGNSNDARIILSSRNLRGLSTELDATISGPTSIGLSLVYRHRN